MLLSTPFLSSCYLKLPVKLCVLEASLLICHPPPPLANEIVCENLKVPVFVGGVFFILTRDLDLQKMWVACIKEQKIISCLYSWHLLNNFSFVNIFCKSRLTFFHCIWCVLRVSTYVLCVQHVFTIGMILSATERHTTGGDNSNKGCFGRKTNLFRESGDFAGNRETWEIFREIWDIFGTLSKDLILHVIKQYIYSDMHPVYALYSMYFDTWKRLNFPWYERTNQQRFQLK